MGSNSPSTQSKQNVGVLAQRNTESVSSEGRDLSAISVKAKAEEITKIRILVVSLRHINVQSVPHLKNSRLQAEVPFKINQNSSPSCDAEFPFFIKQHFLFSFRFVIVVCPLTLDRDSIVCVKFVRSPLP